jgi:hypothetical protein
LRGKILVQNYKNPETKLIVHYLCISFVTPEFM